MELKTVKEQMRREHRQLKIRKFIRNRALMIGAVVTVLMILLAALSRGIAPYDPLEIDVTKRLMPPCGAYVFGTDTFGRDVLSRILYGTAISMKVGLVVSVTSFVIGLVMGLYSGYYPRLGAVLMRLCDGLKAIPSLILAIALVGVMGAGMRNVI